MFVCLFSVHNFQILCSCRWFNVSWVNVQAKANVKIGKTLYYQQLLWVIFKCHNNILLLLVPEVKVHLEKNLKGDRESCTTHFFKYLKSQWHHKLLQLSYSCCSVPPLRCSGKSVIITGHKMYRYWSVCAWLA